MKDRIKQIMDSENMSPARFADSLGIGRAVISHVLNGRNNPSLEVITRILTKIPTINTDWLLTGEGTMYKTDLKSEIKSEKSNEGSFPDLFSQFPPDISKNTVPNTENKDNSKEKLVELPEQLIQQTINEKIIYKETPSKKIRQIIIYYNDNTFETFSSNN